MPDGLPRDLFGSPRKGEGADRVGRLPRPWSETGRVGTDQGLFRADGLHGTRNHCFVLVFRIVLAETDFQFDDWILFANSCFFTGCVQLHVLTPFAGRSSEAPEPNYP